MLLYKTYAYIICYATAAASRRPTILPFCLFRAHMFLPIVANKLKKYKYKTKNGLAKPFLFH